MEEGATTEWMWSEQIEWTTTSRSHHQGESNSPLATTAAANPPRRSGVKMYNDPDVPQEGDPLAEEDDDDDAQPIAGLIEYDSGADSDNARDFMAIKPWLGAIYPPAKYRKDPTDKKSRENVFTEDNNNWEAPDVKIELDYVFGYRARQCRNNVFWIDEFRLVYFAGEVCIVYDMKRHDQDFYFGHNDDVICIDYHDGTGLCASGSIGSRDTVRLCIWEVDKENLYPGAEKKTRHIITGFHMYAVTSVNFSPSGTLVVSLGLDEHHSVAVHSVETGQLLACSQVDKNRVLEVKFNTSLTSADPESCFACCGFKHITFWEPASTRVKGAAFYLAALDEPDRMLKWYRGTKCSVIDEVAFTAIENSPKFALFGATNGSVYAFHARVYGCVFAVKLGTSPIQAMCPLDAAGISVAVGGKDGILRLMDFSDTGGAPSVSFVAMDGSSELDVNRLDEATEAEDDAFMNSIRSVNFQLSTKRLLVGTILSHIYAIELPLSTRDAPKSITIVSGHWGNLLHPDGYGEIWGLDTHPFDQKAYSTSTDGTLRLWDLKTYDELQRMHLLSSGISVSASTNGKMVAVGHINGSFTIVDAQMTGIMWPNTRHRRRRVTDIQFSPNCRYLAVASEMVVDVYSVVEGDPSTDARGAAFPTTPLAKIHKLLKDGVIVNRVGTCRGHTSGIKHLDWNLASTMIQCTSSGSELLYFTTPDCGRITGARYLSDQHWFTQTCEYGWYVQGIWPRFSDATDINSVGRSHGEDLLATTDDFGQVCVYNFPCVGSGMNKFGHLTHRPDCIVLRGHSSHVTQCVWSAKDKFLVTAGGADLCIMSWKITKPDTAKEVFIDAEFINALQAELDAAMKKKKKGALPTGLDIDQSPLNTGRLPPDVVNITDPKERLKRLRERISQKVPPPTLVPNCTMCEYEFPNAEATTCPRCMMPRKFNKIEGRTLAPKIIKARPPVQTANQEFEDAFTERAKAAEKESAKPKFDLRTTQVTKPTKSFAMQTRESLRQRRELESREAPTKWTASAVPVTDSQAPSAFKRSPQSAFRRVCRVDVESDDEAHDARLVQQALRARRHSAPTVVPGGTGSGGVAKASRKPTSGPSFMDV